LDVSLPKEKTNIVLSELLFSPFQATDFYGSVDVNIDGQICLYHVPMGKIKPAILLIHPLILKNENQKINLKKFFGRNVRVRGEILTKKGMDYVLVEQIEFLILER
jgi:hypothetical protein